MCTFLLQNILCVKSRDPSVTSISTLSYAVLPMAKTIEHIEYNIEQETESGSVAAMSATIISCKVSGSKSG